MKRIFLDIQDEAFLSSNTSNAISKPRKDTQLTLTESGYEPIILYGDFHLEGLFPKNLSERIAKKLNRWVFSAQIVKTWNIKKSEVFVQYPFLSNKMYDILQRLKKKGCTITILFHDFYTLREKRENDTLELSLLTLADKVIVHSEPMAETFMAFDCNADIKILKYFDYRLPKDFEYAKPEDGRTIVFAGNLEKAPFITELQNIGTSQSDNTLPLHYHIYGKPAIATNYCGSFDSDSPTGVTGDWGLVWDGDRCDKCSGLMGNYTRYNAPFKFSLYLSLGLPVIVWDRSAVAQYVKEENIGITVSSLHDIPSAMSSLTEEQMTEIRSNVKNIAQNIRKGEQVKSIL